MVFLLQRFLTSSDGSLQSCHVTRIVNACLNTLPSNRAEEVSLFVGECVMATLNIANLVKWPVDGRSVVSPFGEPVQAYLIQSETGEMARELIGMVLTQSADGPHLRVFFFGEGHGPFGNSPEEAIFQSQCVPRKSTTCCTYLETVLPPLCD